MGKDQWFLVEAPKKLELPKGWINIVSHSGLCVASRLKNGALTQQNCTSRDNLLWKVEEYKNGFVIENKTKRVMYNSGNSMLGYVRNNRWQSIWSIESVMHGKYITFRNIHRKTYCLDDYGKHVKNNKYRTFACSNENKNQWFLLQTPEQTQKLYPEGYFNIIGKSGLCVSSRLKNSNLQQEKCGELDTLLWTVERNGDGLYLLNKTKRAMEGYGSTVRGYIKQKTTKQLYPNGYFNIIGKTGLCVAARNNNSNLVQVNCGEFEDLLWKTEKLEDGLKITNKTKRQMDAMGARVYGYVKQNTDRQVWAIESVNNGKHVAFRNYKKNKCLDDTGKADNNKPYRMWKCDNENKDQWFLLEAPKKLELPKGWINIVSHSGLCVASRLKNGSLTQQKCTSRDNLLWKVEEYKNGFVIENKTKRVMYNSGNGMLGYVRNNSWQSIWSIESVMHGK